MPFWRRDSETLNEKLAREAGLSLAGDPAAASEHAEERGLEERIVDLFRSAAGPAHEIAGVHSPHEARRWDVVTTAIAPGVQGSAVHFVGLPSGDLVVDEDVPDEALDVFAAAVESSVAAPYRAEALRRGADSWAVAARRIEVVHLPDDVDGDEIELAVGDGERTATVDGEPAYAGLRPLEELGEGHERFVVRATRIDGALWEVELFPL